MAKYRKRPVVIIDARSVPGVLEGTDIRLVWLAMCAATPIAADDPAIVERVARMIDPHNINWDNGIDTLRKRALRDKALAVLRLFTPERP